MFVCGELIVHRWMFNPVSGNFQKFAVHAAMCIIIIIMRALQHMTLQKIE